MYSWIRVCSPVFSQFIVLHSRSFNFCILKTCFI